MTKYSRKEILGFLGRSPEEIGAELNAFAEASKVLSSDHPRLIDSHPRQWVGVYEGAVAASANGFESLMTELSERGIPPAQTIVRYIDKAEKTFVL